MRRTATLAATAALAFGATVFTATPASAHGYVSSPPSRQAFCAQGKVSCGAVKYEPQSVEGAKGQRTCHGGVARFAELNDDTKAWPTTAVGTSVDFNWVLTARHATSTWQYYIGDKLIATFNDGGKQPGATVTHKVSLAGYSGKQKVLAVWNIADTAAAFYSCIDLQVGGTGGGTPAPSPTQKPTTPAPTPTKTATPAPLPSPTSVPKPTAVPTTHPTTPAGTWKRGGKYVIGNVVTYRGVKYRCIQSHTAYGDWAPPLVPALWKRLG
ncbi:lytic polysaccharide monooxygenase [Planomonospora venezuelensis]|uniref:Chitin-binding protein n=1 Tax=Planomonospora venezuelensis TaxID=1999 RepID=A0A841D5Q7_PLAVE|nr:lytic polysaccharide monooxygenase [Planomonospora venezuelensis]MBB5963688.1 chitin-binding protein [Planomonospora venezuelensis]GIN01478.1 cellulose-binding protein [Planomonospora venezuelensis]